MSGSVESHATSVVPDHSSVTDSDGDSLLRELAGAPPRAPAVVHLLAPGAIVGGKYRIEEKIGTGGMGAVFRATDLRLQRPVAIKVHHGRATSVERLRREARLLARLSHPNVVTVMEVGSYEGAPFVAMEYVAGGSARAWARREGRTWREIVAVYVQAARGLAAAHAIGIVHRDFKPDNLLVGDDGRARVADFGLADEDLSSAEDVRLVQALQRVGISTDSRAPEITAAGAFVGTPAYVAPEQIRSSRVDARADQFSFCAGLFEALYGELPFPGTTAVEVLARILDGDLAEPPGRRGVPRWLHAVVCRGLAHSPEQRFADMDALREALAPPRSRHMLGIAGGGAIVAALVLLATREAEIDPRCIDDASVGWDARRTAIGNTFAAHDDAARDAWRRLDRRLHDRTQGWSAAWVTACAAEREGATPLALSTMRRRLDCLDDERGLTDALLDALALADPDVAVHLLESASTWGDPLSCIADDTTKMDAPDPAAAPDAGGIRASLQRINALSRAGQSAAAAALAEITLDQAQELRDDRAIAQALLARGGTRLDIGRHDAGVEDATAAFNLAERTGDIAVMRDAATRLAFVSRFAEGNVTMDWITRARRYLTRWPDDADMQVKLLVLEAGVRAERGEIDPAMTLLDEAEAITVQAALADDITATIWFERAALATTRGDFGNAVSHGERGRELIESALGAKHYRVGEAWATLAFTYDSAGNYAEARDHYRRALALLESVGGGMDHRQITILVQIASLETLLGNSKQALVDLDRAAERAASLAVDDDELEVTTEEARGMALLDLGRTEEAYAVFVRVSRMREDVWGTAHPRLRPGLLNLALAARSTGRTAEAKAALARAVKIQDDLEDDHLLASEVYHGYGFALLDEGDHDLAATQFERADKLLQRGFGDDHPDHAWPALGLGRVELARDHPTEALAWFERAKTAWASDDADAQGKAELAMSTAEAMRRLGRNDEAIAIARAAMVARPEHVGLRSWLDEHAPGAVSP